MFMPFAQSGSSIIALFMHEKNLMFSCCRTHYENEANQIRRIAQERAQAEIDRIREEEENKRRILSKKHAVNMGPVHVPD